MSAVSTPQPVERIKVDAEQFCQMLLSRRQLVRTDDEQRGLVGLLDLQSGQRYWVSEMEFDRYWSRT